LPPKFNVKTETSCPKAIYSCVKFSAYVPKPPTIAGGY
jgi:hypothetical protein